MTPTLASTAEELARWEAFTGHDRWGTYTIITGFEDTGGCFWCGAALEGKRRFCGHKSGHWTEYANHFYWSYARSWCCKRQEGRCANCGWHPALYSSNDIHFYWYGLEVHHIIHLNGGPRASTPFNLPWNLIGLCHECHQEIHAVMRPPRTIPDSWEKALLVGQGVMELSYGNTKKVGE